MVAEKFIDDLFAKIHIWRQFNVSALETFQRTMNYTGVEEVCPSLFPRAADSRWRVHACDHVLHVREDVTSLSDLRVVSEGLKDELASAGRAGDATHIPRAYWETLGNIWQEVSALIHVIEGRTE